LRHDGAARIRSFINGSREQGSADDAHEVLMEEPSEDRPWLLALMRAMAPPLPAVQRLIAEFGSLEAAFAEARRMPVHPGLEALRHPDWKGVERDLRWIERDGNDFIAWNSPRYPAQLAEIARSEEHTSELQSRENLVC